MREEYDLSKLKVKRRGVLPSLQEQTQVQITLSLDSDIIEYFKHQAEKNEKLTYQQHINLALRNLIIG